MFPFAAPSDGCLPQIPVAAGEGAWRFCGREWAGVATLRHSRLPFLRRCIGHFGYQIFTRGHPSETRDYGHFSERVLIPRRTNCQPPSPLLAGAARAVTEPHSTALAKSTFKAGLAVIAHGLPLAAWLPF